MITRQIFAVTCILMPWSALGQTDSTRSPAAPGSAARNQTACEPKDYACLGAGSDASSGAGQGGGVTANTDRPDLQRPMTERPPAAAYR